MAFIPRVHFTFGANEFAATQSDVRLRGQHLLPTQVGMAMACCDLQLPQLAPKLKCTPIPICRIGFLML
jgi:hypothetical protein